MADEGWEMRLWCPHGVEHRGPVKALRGLEPLQDVCETAKLERALKEQPRLSRKEKRKFRRIVGDLIAPNAEQPPSSETKDSPR